jgi:hypothetical protein
VVRPTVGDGWGQEQHGEDQASNQVGHDAHPVKASTATVEINADREDVTVG